MGKRKNVFPISLISLSVAQMFEIRITWLNQSAFFIFKILMILISCRSCTKWAIQEWMRLWGTHRHASKLYVYVWQSQLKFVLSSCRHPDPLQDVGEGGKGSFWTALWHVAINSLILLCSIQLQLNQLQILWAGCQACLQRRSIQSYPQHTSKGKEQRKAQQ